jgi:alpha-tubulin suppressor-like RCC1 family protein
MFGNQAPFGSRLGDGTTTDRLTPVTVSGLGSGVASISTGSIHTCAVTTAGAAMCWGAGGFGRLGNGDIDPRLTPAAVSGLGSGVAAIDAGGFHTCARTTAGVTTCWGNNDGGQLGNNTRTGSLTPIEVIF